MASTFRRALRRPRRAEPVRAVTGPVPGFDERLWLDGDDVASEARIRTTDPVRRRHAEELATAGITKIEGAIPAELCDRVRAEYEAYCDDHTDEAAALADESGFRSRLANLHLASAAALAVGADARVMALLDFLFGYRAAIYSSLTFERGTQQRIHRDTPYFCTEPPRFFFGVWTALEDVRPNAGPLVYLPGAQSIEIDQYELAGGVHYQNANHPDQVPLDPGAVYNDAVAELAADRGIEPAIATAAKGDTLIWHPELPHGGSPITSPTATRASIVFHCAPEGVPVFGPDRFFAADRSQDWELLRYRFDAERAYLDLGRPTFEPNDD